MNEVDVIVVGAGVVGLAIAARLSQQFDSVLIIDKNKHFGEETSSRNSEVIHAGIYYPKHSLKARLCVEGKHRLYEYCQQRHIPHHNIGKLIVAQSEAEVQVLQTTLEKAVANGVEDCRWVSATELKHREPALAAHSALLSPSTGIVDAHSLMQSLLAEAESNGAWLVAQTHMTHAEPTNNGLTVTMNSQGEAMRLGCRYLINSAGLHAVNVAHSIEGLNKQSIPTLHLCRGHYFAYQGKSPFSQLIYPVPDPQGIGLGIHGTLDLGHQLRFGPDTQYIEQIDYAFPDIQGPTSGAISAYSNELPPTLKDQFVAAIRRYFPSLDPLKLSPAYAGIRPKLQGPHDSVQDFMIQNNKDHGLNGLINLFGIESPGLTASLAIAEYVAQNLE